MKNTRVKMGIGISIILLFTVAYIVLLLNKYWQFSFFAVDNVYFDSALWKLAHLQAPIVHHPILGWINIFGDHFHPTIFFFAMLYWLTSRQEIIFIGMSVAYGLSAYLGMLVSFKLIKSKVITYALLIAYFLYVGTQNAMIYGFHELNLVPVFFMLTTYCIIFGRWRWYWVSLALLLLTKESLAIVAVCIGFFIALSFPKHRKEGFLTILLSIAYYFLAIKVIIPHFAGTFLYGTDIDYPRSISQFVQQVTVPHEKVETFLVSMATFGFLPLLNIFTLPLVLQDFLTRYIIAIPGNVQYTLFFHYNLALAPLLFFSSIWSIKTIQDNHFLKRFVRFLPLFAVLVLLFTVYFHRLYGKRGPLLLLTNKAFYQTTKDNAFEWDLVRNTPHDGTVLTQNHLAYLYSHQGAFLFPSPNKLNDISEINAKYIVVDFREGQNPNNYFPLDIPQTKKLIADLEKEKIYSVFYQKGELYILKKTSNKPIPRNIEKVSVKVALINVSGKGEVGCGDAVQSVDREVTYSPYTYDKVKYAIQDLISMKKQKYGNTGLFNSLYQSSLVFQKLNLEGDEAKLYLIGSVQLGGVCDAPRLQAQLEQTVLQFPEIKKVAIFINDKPLSEVLSEK